MHILLLLVTVAMWAVLAAVMIGACTAIADQLRAKSEDLSETLYVRASWRDPWLGLVPRGNYDKGTGYVRSSFQIGRSEPSTDEESWQTIQKLSDNASGACALTYNQTYNGFHEDQYKPEMFGLMGPLVCQDDFTMYWKSAEFWEKYFQALEKRNRKSVINRLGNIYRQYVPKAAANSSFTFVAGDVATQPAPQVVDLSGLAASPPTSELTQEMLDATAQELLEEGADEPNSNGWITQGPQGAVFPLLIGQNMSNRLFLNNSELRTDLNQSFQGWGEANPVIKRMGASGILKNFRHVINRFPARWALMRTGEQLNYTSTGLNSTTGVQQYIQATIAGAVATFTVKLLSDNSTVTTFTATAAGGQAYVRIPTWTQSTQSADATKGQVAVVNGVWRDAAVANYESVEVLNPWVMTEEVLMPVNSMPGMKLKPQNYFGEWNFVTGNDALLGIGGCTGITDPLHKQGRHFAEYRHALHPIFPLFGRLILFIRCPSSFDTITCS